MEERLNYIPSQNTKLPLPERERVSTEQEKEKEWWSEAPVMGTVGDIENAIESGKAVRVPDVGEGYRLSPGVKEEFKALEKQTYELMRAITNEWLTRVRLRDVNNSDLYLRVTSLARTVEYQRELIDQGYPAVEDSTHTRLGAFDILSSWLATNRPDLLADLDIVLEQYAVDGRINWIKEPEIGAYHVALNPNKIH